ncbi:MAG TPA: family 20 glycosylhydrolase, partial [Saprospiraceae bacterium]|nr:family 20 glycosylhydrolase [Saprospiraceae bacterium]
MKLLNKLPVTMVTIMLLLTLKTIAQNSGSLVPLPVSLTEKKGNSTLSGSVSIFCNEPSLFDALQLFSSQLALTSGIKSGKTANQQQADIIILKQQDYKSEQYSLNISPDKIVIKAATPQGVFYAGQTLMQLCPPEIFGNKKSIMGKIELPCMEIKDYPRFQYRGMHLDVCRHFFPKEFVMKYIDFIAMHKMNYFHFHLTDDQGWRIEIKKYPKLTEIGSKRKGTLIGSYSDVPHRFDTIAYGGYYTQDDIRQIVDYAAKRYVTVIPEIEMPGHAMAAIAAYPEL